jgi:CO/xanthine dehydrogenase Mo-binding subunit
MLFFSPSNDGQGRSFQRALNPDYAGEIDVVGTGAAIANAVCHATGVRVRDLPITVDKLPARGF